MIFNLPLSTVYRIRAEITEGNYSDFANKALVKALDGASK